MQAQPQWNWREPYKTMHLPRGDGRTLCGLTISDKWQQAGDYQMRAYSRCAECKRRAALGQQP